MGIGTQEDQPQGPGDGLKVGGNLLDRAPVGPGDGLKAGGNLPGFELPEALPALASGIGPRRTSLKDSGPLLAMGSRRAATSQEQDRGPGFCLAAVPPWSLRRVTASGSAAPWWRCNTW